MNRNVLDILETPSKNCLQIIYDKEVISGGAMEIKNGGDCSIECFSELFKKYSIISTLSFVENRLIICLDIISEAYKNKHIKNIITSIPKDFPTMYVEQKMPYRLKKLLHQAVEDGGGFYVENGVVKTIGACSQCLGKEELIKQIELCSNKNKEKY